MDALELGCYDNGTILQDLLPDNPKGDLRRANTEFSAGKRDESKFVVVATELLGYRSFRGSGYIKTDSMECGFACWGYNAPCAHWL